MDGLRTWPRGHQLSAMRFYHAEVHRVGHTRCAAHARALAVVAAAEMRGPMWLGEWGQVVGHFVDAGANTEDAVTVLDVFERIYLWVVRVTSNSPGAGFSDPVTVGLYNVPKEEVVTAGVARAACARGCVAAAKREMDFWHWMRWGKTCGSADDGGHALADTCVLSLAMPFCCATFCVAASPAARQLTTALAVLKAAAHLRKSIKKRGRSIKN